MTTIHLDTNYLIHAGQPDHLVQTHVQGWRANGDTFAVSAMAWGEFLCGPVSPGARGSWERLLAGAILPTDQGLAESAADLFNGTGRRARSLPDCVIAATAIRENAPLATLNRADFQPFVAFGLILA